MGQMICSKCHKHGIYWENVGSYNAHTYCPHCKDIGYQIVNEGPEEPNQKVVGSISTPNY